MKTITQLIWREFQHHWKMEDASSTAEEITSCFRFTVSLVMAYIQVLSNFVSVSGHSEISIILWLCILINIVYIIMEMSTLMLYYIYTGTVLGTLQYKSLLNVHFMSRELMERLDQLNNPGPEPQQKNLVRKLRQVSNLISSIKVTQTKRKTSVARKQTPRSRKHNTISPTIAE